MKRLCISKIFFIALCLQFIGNHERSSVALGNTTGESCSVPRRGKPQSAEHTRFVVRCLCCSWWALSPDIITLLQYLHTQRAREGRRFKPEIFQLFGCFTHFLLKEATSICGQKNQYLKTAPKGANLVGLLRSHTLFKFLIMHYKTDLCFKCTLCNCPRLSKFSVVQWVSAYSVVSNFSTPSLGRMCTQVLSNWGLTSQSVFSPENLPTDVNVEFRSLPHDHELAVLLHLKKKTNKKSLKINKV